MYKNSSMILCHYILHVPTNSKHAQSNSSASKLGGIRSNRPSEAHCKHSTYCVLPRKRNLSQVIFPRAAFKINRCSIDQSCYQSRSQGAQFLQEDASERAWHRREHVWPYVAAREQERGERNSKGQHREQCDRKRRDQRNDG